MDLGLRGKVALVAGASAGIGYAIAEALAFEGASVVVASRSEDRIREAALRIQRATGSEARGVALDVRDPDAGARFVDAAHHAFGPALILVTNAGGPPPGPFARFDVQDFEEAMRLNFLGAVGLTKAALPDMETARWGRIVHITSSTVPEPAVRLFLSSAVRPAVAGFSKALATEVAASGITVNMVCPGFIKTARLQELVEHRSQESGLSPSEEFEALNRTVPVGRVGSPAELAAAVAFLCSEPAAYITGTVVRVDGGKVSSLL
jgi:3-oxoacyl-[acyl-carrier protein] reductase